MMILARSNFTRKNKIYFCWMIPCLRRQFYFLIEPKVPYFIFSREKFRPHSLTRFRGKLFFFSENFFSGPNFSILAILFFFPRKSLESTHSLKLISRKKKYSTGKKKSFISLTHSIFPRKWQKLNFSREIKKYGTFGSTNKKY